MLWERSEIEGKGAESFKDRMLVQFNSVTQFCPTLCDPMDCSMPGFPVHHQLPDLAQTQCPSSWWCHPAILSSAIPFSYHQSSPASRSFPVSQFFISSDQGFRVSASVLPMNIQDWFPLGLTGLISLQSKGLSRVFSNTMVFQFQKNQTVGSGKMRTLTSC